MEDKILFQGILLLITSLFTIVGSLAGYIWHSSIRDYDKQMKRSEKILQKLEDVTDDHEKRLVFLETEHNMNTCKKRKK